MIELFGQFDFVKLTTDETAHPTQSKDARAAKYSFDDYVGITFGFGFSRF
jgi:hypothetical protein